MRRRMIHWISLASLGLGILSFWVNGARQARADGPADPTPTAGMTEALDIDLKADPRKDEARYAIKSGDTHFGSMA